MEQHGISNLPEKPATTSKYKKKNYPLAILAGPIVIMLWAGVGLSLLLWSSKVMDGEHPLWGFLIAIIGLLVLGAPFVKNK